MILGRLPRGVVTLLHEVARHLLRRPVVGVVVVARTADGRWLLVRRADTGTWALPGGTVEWGETLRTTVVRELDEEAGCDVEDADIGALLGAWSRPDRDPRFHAVTVVVACAVREPSRPPKNPLEIREARLFTDADLPHDLAMGHADLVEAARAGRVVIE